MNISPITYNTNNYQKPQVKQSFKGGLSDKQVDKALNMLNAVTTETRIISDEKLIPNAFAKLLGKYNLTPRSGLGLLVVPQDKMANIKQMHPDKNIDRVLIAAVGDKYGPIETWNKAYEAIRIILTKGNK